MNSDLARTSKINVAVVGIGYWGKNLVRNFHELGALAMLCDGERYVEERCGKEYKSVSLCGDFSVVLSDPSISAIALATKATTLSENAKAAIDVGEDILVVPIFVI